MKKNKDFIDGVVEWGDKFESMKQIGTSLQARLKNQKTEAQEKTDDLFLLEYLSRKYLKNLTVKQYLDFTGMTVSGFARAANISPKSIGSYLRGERPRGDVIKKLNKLTNGMIDYVDI